MLSVYSLLHMRMLTVKSFQYTIIEMTKENVVYRRCISKGREKKIKKLNLDFSSFRIFSFHRTS